MPSDSNKPNFSPGSIVRIAYHDEIYPPGDYGYEVNDGWIPKGVTAYRSKNEALGRYEHADEDHIDFAVDIPWGTKHLLFVEFAEDTGLKTSTKYWCHLIWEERSVWVHQDWIVLQKRAADVDD